MHGSLNAPLETVLGYAELALIFRRARSHIPNTITCWTRSRHFPPPLPGSKPKLWSAARVKEWIDAVDDAAREAVAAGAQQAYASGAVPQAVVLDARRRLEQRYRRLA